jgi:ankyrin repeat protein
MQELIEEGANVNGESTSRGNTPLHKVILSMLKMQQQRAPYSFNAIILLANSKANFKAKNHKGETPLELAQSGYDAELVRLLLDHSS